MGFVFRESDFEKYPEMHSIIDFRLKKKYRDFFDNHKPPFDGFDDFGNEKSLMNIDFTIGE